MLKYVVQIWINICYVFKSMYFKFKLLLAVPWQPWRFFFFWHYSSRMRIDFYVLVPCTCIIMSHAKAYFERGRRTWTSGDTILEVDNYWDHLDLLISIDKSKIIIITLIKILLWLSFITKGTFIIPGHGKVFCFETSLR